jgi:RimJ/RimL family protein N-acetyltransferase
LRSVVKLLAREPDPSILRIVEFWIANFAPAIRIYEGLGFVHEGEARAAIRIGNQRFGNLTMSMLRSEYEHVIAVDEDGA